MQNSVWAKMAANIIKFVTKWYKRSTTSCSEFKKSYDWFFIEIIVSILNLFYYSAFLIHEFLMHAFLMYSFYFMNDYFNKKWLSKRTKLILGGDQTE